MSSIRHEESDTSQSVIVQAEIHRGDLEDEVDNHGATSSTAQSQGGGVDNWDHLIEIRSPRTRRKGAKSKGQRPCNDLSQRPRGLAVDPSSFNVAPSENTPSPSSSNTALREPSTPTMPSVSYAPSSVDSVENIPLSSPGQPTPNNHFSSQNYAQGQGMTGIGSSPHSHHQRPHPITQNVNAKNAKKVALLIVLGLCVYHGMLHLSYGKNQIVD